jgi:hypothetical protein
VTSASPSALRRSWASRSRPRRASSSASVVVKAEDVERLSPLQLGHGNLLGRYEFAMRESIRLGKLRPLREPDEMADLAA